MLKSVDTKGIEINGIQGQDLWASSWSAQPLNHGLLNHGYGRYRCLEKFH